MSKKRPPRLSQPRPKHHGAIEAYKQRARVLVRDNQLDSAINVYKQAVALAPHDTNLFFELGRLKVKQRKFHEGKAYLDKALGIDPDFVPALVEMGQALSQQNDLEGASPILERALELAPDSPTVHLVFGVMKQKAGELPEAIEHFRYALELRIAHPTKNNKTSAVRQDFDKPSTEELMWDTLSLLAKSGVHAFAAYGTLLGLVRDGGLLPFDKDIDFGIPYCEMEKARQCLESNGWIVSNVKNMTNPLAFWHPVKGITLDLSGFVVDPSTGETFTGFWMSNIPYEWARNTKYLPIDLRKGVSPTGQPIWVLQDPEEWLEVIYGDWTVPDPYFDTVIAAKNLCGFSLLTQCYAFSRIFSHWEKGNLKKALATTIHAIRHLPDDKVLGQVESCLSSAIAE